MCVPITHALIIFLIGPSNYVNNYLKKDSNIRKIPLVSIHAVLAYISEVSKNEKNGSESYK